MREILFENGLSVAQIAKNDDGKPQWLIPSEDGNGMIYVSYKEFETYVKSLAHVFIMMNKENEYREFWQTVKGEMIKWQKENLNTD